MILGIRLLLICLLSSSELSFSQQISLHSKEGDILSKEIDWVKLEEDSFSNLINKEKNVHLDFTWTRPPLRIISKEKSGEMVVYSIMPWRNGDDLLILPTKVIEVRKGKLILGDFVIGKGFTVNVISRAVLEKKFPVLKKFAPQNNKE